MIDSKQCDQIMQKFLALVKIIKVLSNSLSVYLAVGIFWTYFGHIFGIGQISAIGNGQSQKQKSIHLVTLSQ